MFIPEVLAPRINFVFMTPAQKFTKSLEESPFTPAQFARLMDVEPQTIQNWKSRGIPARLTFQIAKLLGKDPQWLMLDDADLPEDFTPASAEQEEHAVALFEMLTESQRELIHGLITEFARK